MDKEKEEMHGFNRIKDLFPDIEKSTLIKF